MGALNGAGNRIHGVILASGLGRRQRALCNPSINRFARPKAMLPVGNRVLIDYSIQALQGLGLKTIYVGAGPRPLSEILERRLTDRDLYDLDIQVHPEEKVLDTAGTVKYLMENFLAAEPKDTICVLPADTPHEIDLNPIFQAHLEKEAAVTIATLPIEWSSKEWKERNLGTIQMEIMPDVEEYKDRGLFEADIRNIAESLKENSYQVTGFHEEQEIGRARSNLVNIHIYFINAGFLTDLAPFITPKDAEHRFSDFGHHVFPFLAGRYTEFSDCFFSDEFMKKVETGDYPFYTYLLPFETYWRDVGNPIALLGANRDVLDGKLNGQPVAHRPGQSLTQSIVGAIDGLTQFLRPKSIISNNAVIHRRAKIKRSIILDNNEIEGEVINSICFPGPSLREKGIIEKGVSLRDSIFVGGELRSNEHKIIRDRIVYVTPDGGIAFDPLYTQGRK